MRTTSRFTAAAATMVVLLSPLTACSSTEEAAPQHDTSAAARPEDNATTLGHRFVPDPTLVDPSPLPFTSWTRLGEDTIAVNFQTGNPACFAVDATVTEAADTVTIALRSGTRADAVGKMCTMDAVLGTMELTLRSPLGSRAVLDAE